MMQSLQGALSVQQQMLADNMHMHILTRCKAEAILEFTQWLWEYRGDTALLDCTL